jgi:molecular chaperone HtpG
MNEYKSVIGKKLIEILMFSMYPDAKIIYREYIQNARDAIKNAVDAGTLQQLNDGHIAVLIDKNQRKITIQDNGTGVSVNEVEPVLLNIADSTKNGETSAGQFGIGRLVGGGYCKKLTFKTSFSGEKYASKITFDIEKARAILDDNEDCRSATEVMDTIVEIEKLNEEENKHYFTVILAEVHPEYYELLNEQIISGYLKEVAPIDYQFVFKNKLVKTSLLQYPEYKELQEQVGHCRLTINNESDIRKKYELKIAGTGDIIRGLEYFKIHDDKYGLLAWGWYALTEFSQAIPDSDNNRGFRLRKHNILIGDKDFLNKFHKEPRGNKYFYGEIHAVHIKIKPNSARDGLAPTLEAMRLQELLKEYFAKLYQLYHFASQIKTATRDFVAAKAEIQQAPKHDAPDIEEKLETATKKLESVTNSIKAKSEAGQKVIEIYKEKLKDIGKNSPMTNPQVTTNNKTTVVQPPVSITPKQVIDKFDILEQKYTKEEISILKRAFKYLKDNSPSQYTKLIDELTTKVIKELGK